MITQVQELPKLSEEWQLSREERYHFYVECAHLLMAEGDSTAAFKLYFEASILFDGVKGGMKPEIHAKTAQALIISAIKSPSILNFEEILALSVV